MVQKSDIKERETRKLRDGYSYLRVEVPEDYAKKLNKAFAGQISSDGVDKVRQGRDDSIFADHLKDLADEFDIGKLSKDRADSPYAHLAKAAKAYAEAETVTINVAFDKLKTLQENVITRALKS